MQIWPGRPYPLGATYDGAGVNFALFSEVADKVELCLIADDGTESRIELVDLQQVHVTGLAQQRRVHGDEVVVGIAVHGRHVVAGAARLDDQRVAAESLEEAVDLLVPLRDVDPDEPVVAAEQLDHVVGVVGVRALGVHEPHVHGDSVSLQPTSVEHPATRAFPG